MTLTMSTAVEDASDVDAWLAAYERQLGLRPSVSLDQVLQVAELTRRRERKYVVPVSRLPELLGGLPDDDAVLAIAGRRVFHYESVYYDTEAFTLYRSHSQGRRKRYKARVRTYRDTGERMFEVKLKGPRGETVKQRLAYDHEVSAGLSPAGRAFLQAVVSQAYSLPVPEVGPRLTTSYCRSTLVNLNQRTRTTIDTRLSWSDGQTLCAADDLALVESKTTTGSASVDVVLARMGVRPVQLSKYCIGVALLHRELSANRWNRLLTRHFGWRRDPVA